MSHLLTVIRQVEGQVKLNWGMIRGCSARQNMVHEGCISQKELTIKASGLHHWCKTSISEEEPGSGKFKSKQH